MEIRAHYCRIIFNCFLIFPSFTAKTFSLNEAIAAEARNQASITLPRLSDTQLIADHLPTYNQRNRDILPKLQPAKTSPLQYRKTFLIKPPVWPKLLKRSQNRLRPVNPVKQSKRESDNHDEINQNYIPLFRSLSIILDNILNTDSSEITSRNKFKRNPIKHDANDIVCDCAYRPTTKSHLSSSYEETIIPTFVSSEVEAGTVTVSPITTPKTHRATNNNIRNLRRNKNVPILPTRNTDSFRRNANGLHEGRGTAHIRNTKGTLTGDNRNNEHNTRNGLVEPLTENSEEDTDDDTRYSSSCHESRERRTNGTYTRDSNGKGNKIDELIHTPVSSLEGNVFEHKGQNQFTNRRIQTESAVLLPEHTTRLHGTEPENKTEITQSKEKDYAAIERYITSAKRVSNRNSTNPTENKKHRRANEAITPHSLQLESPNNKVVMIFDGYSIARDVNGPNKMSEKAIEIRT